MVKSTVARVAISKDFTTQSLSWDLTAGSRGKKLSVVITTSSGRVGSALLGVLRFADCIYIPAARNCGRQQLICAFTSPDK